MLAKCRELGIVTAAFYVPSFGEDTRESISATIDYSVDLGSTVAQFKILTPYPGTPLWQADGANGDRAGLERFDGFTPTFASTLSAQELKFLLGSAYALLHASVVSRETCAFRRRKVRRHHTLDARVRAAACSEKALLLPRSAAC